MECGQGAFSLILDWWGLLGRYELTIKDITKTIEMELKNIQDTNFTLYGEINRKDFQLDFKKLNKIGGVMVGNTVKITLKLKGTLAN